MTYLGDYAKDETISFLWSTNDAAGASVTRATDGTVSVYRNNDATQSTAGVTDTEDFDSLTGIHACTIDTSADAFYATEADYAVVLSAATIDGETVNAVLAHFSIQNRTSPTVTQIWDEMLSNHPEAGSAGDQLNNTASIVQTANIAAVQAISGNTVTVYKGDTWSFDIENLPLSMADYEVLILVVKRAAGDDDDDAMLILRNDEDIVRIGGGAPLAPGNGTLTWNSTVLSVYVDTAETMAAGLTAGTYGFAVVGFDTTPPEPLKYTLAVGVWVINAEWLQSIPS